MRILCLVLVTLFSLSVCTGCAQVKAKGVYEVSTGYSKK